MSHLKATTFNAAFLFLTPPYPPLTLMNCPLDDPLVTPGIPDFESIKQLTKLLQIPLIMYNKGSLIYK